MTISIEPVTDAARAYAIAHACQQHDQPDVPFSSPEEFRTLVTEGWPGFVTEYHLALLDGSPAGLLTLYVPLLDNLTLMELELAVLPAARRRGVGRALWDRAVERARALDRVHLVGSTVEARPDGAAFAASVGAVAGLSETRSRLDLRTADRERLDALLTDAWTHADGYRLVQWAGVPPDAIIDDVAYLESRLNADAPTGDLAWEAEEFSAERIRDDEANREKLGRRRYHSGATRDGRLVAWTCVTGLIDDERHARQSTTLVDPEHRGHRLGTIVKLENLRYLAGVRPGLEAIDTYNAEANEHMLRINRAMGFRPVETVVQWQVSL